MNRSTKFLVYVLAFISSLNCWGQSMYYKRSVSIHDYNQDGYTDSLVSEQFYRSGTEVVFYDGKTGKKTEVNLLGDFSTFFYVASIPDEVFANKMLRDSVEKAIFKSKKHVQAEDAEMWLIEAYKSIEKHADSSPYWFSFQFNMNWLPNPIKFPESGYRLVDVEDMGLSERILWNRKGKYAWLWYGGHNHRQWINRSYHDTFVWVSKHQNRELYKTSHGLVLKKKKKHAWVFHTNRGLTGGPDKLRWASIDTAVLYEDVVLVQHKSPVSDGDHLFIIDLKTGLVGRYNLRALVPEDFYEICMEMNRVSNRLELVMRDCSENRDTVVRKTFYIDDLVKQLRKSNNK